MYIYMYIYIYIYIYTHIYNTYIYIIYKIIELDTFSFLSFLSINNNTRAIHMYKTNNK